MPCVEAQSRVRLVGLQARPELNGRLGVALRFVKDKGRWQVRIDGEPSDSSMALKEENLTYVPTYSEALARTVALARERAGEIGKPFKSLHVVTTSDLELSLEYGPLASRNGGDETFSVVVVGSDLPSSYPEKELADGTCNEPGVRLACFKGRYEEFQRSSAFTPADVVVLSNPGAGGAGLEAAFFSWAEALHALACVGSGLFICAGVEPFSDGDWFGDGIYDEMIIRACGFEILSATERNPHARAVPGHRTSNWNLWAYTIAFRYPGSKEDPPSEVDVFSWTAFYKSRCVRNKLPRYRFRPPHPVLKPADDLEALHIEHQEDRKLVEESAMGEDTFGQREMARQERGIYLVTEWLADTVRRSWVFGGHQSNIVSAAAGAVAAAEEFAEKSGRSKPPPRGGMHLIPVAASELAARTTMLGPEACAGLVAVVASGVVLFESLVVEAMWRGTGEVGSEMVGHAVLGALTSAGVELEDGMASAIGQRVADIYDSTKGFPEPLLEALEESFVKFLADICDYVGLGNDADERHAIAHAITENMDLAIAARGGSQQLLEISRKMEKAKPCIKS